MATKFKQIYQLLEDAGIKFILIGGGAANFHGSGRLTLDVDVVYARDRENMEKLVDCLAPLQPYLRGAPPGLPFRFDLRALRQGLNFTLTTTLGNLDLLGEVSGGGTYDRNRWPKNSARTIPDPGARIITPPVPFRWISRSLSVTGG